MIARGLKTHIENAREDGMQGRMGRRKSSGESGLKSQIENVGKHRMVRRQWSAEGGLNL